MPATSRHARMVVLDAQAVINALVRRVVPAVADWCVLYERASADDNRAPSVAASYPYTTDVIEQLLPLTSRVAQARLGVKHAFRTALVHRTSEPLVAGLTRGRPSLVSHGGAPIVPGEVVALPLIADVATRRVLVLARKRERAPFAGTDLHAATQAARAAAIAFMRLDSQLSYQTE